MVKVHETTIKDVAKKAGVSVATVGRVVGGYGSVSSQSRDKVLTAVKELNFVPNAIAQGMRNHSTKTIAVVIGNIKNSFFSEIVYSIEKIATERRFNVLVCNTHENITTEIAYLQNLYSKRIDGIIIAPAYTTNRSIRKEALHLYNGDIPTVFIDRKVKGIKKDLIQSDNIEGGYEATKFLLSLGHKRIGVIASLNYITTFDRISGYKKALIENGIEINEELICYGDYSDKSWGQLAMSKLLDRDYGITAVIAQNNNLCAGALMELKRRKIKIPSDISILAWDDEMINELLDITTVAQSVDEMGKLAAEKLFSMIDNPEAVPRNNVTALETKIILRKSCAPPKNNIIESLDQ